MRTLDRISFNLNTQVNEALSKSKQQLSLVLLSGTLLVLAALLNYRRQFPEVFTEKDRVWVGQPPPIFKVAFRNQGNNPSNYLRLADTQTSHNGPFISGQGPCAIVV